MVETVGNGRMVRGGVCAEFWGNMNIWCKRRRVLGELSANSGTSSRGSAQNRAAGGHRTETTETDDRDQSWLKQISKKMNHRR